MSTKPLVSPTAEDSQQAMDAGNYAYLVPRAEYEGMTARLERAERVVEAARKLAESNGDGPHPYDLRVDTTLTYRQRGAISNIMDALAAFDAGAES